MAKPLYWLKLKMVNGSRLIVLVLIALILNLSCDFNGEKGLNEEGVIEYAITYPDSSSMQFDSNMRPEKLVVKFKNKKTLTSIQALSGAVSLSFIHKSDESSTIILVKLFNKKLYYTENYNSGEMPLVYSQMPNVIIKPTNDIVEIQNYKCSRYIGSFEDDSLSKFDILFTNQIGVANPNEKTPYAAIDGLLMAFTIKMYGQTMSLNATSISKGKVHNSDFEIPKGYEMVSKETINDIFELMQ